MNPDRNNTSCIILAGGRGVRFNNRDKGLVKLDNAPFIEHVVNRIQPQVDDIVISANRNLDRYAQYAATVVKDSTADYQGPLAGLGSALPHCRHAWVLVIPCDMPHLPADLVQHLGARLDDEQIAVAIAADRLQLVFLMQQNLLASIQRDLNQGRHKMMQWLQSHKHVVVEFPDSPHAFANINSELELSRFN